jgi:hypothetical protein
LFGSFLCVRVISVLWPLACEGEEGSRDSLRGACGASGMLPGVFGRLGPPATASSLSGKVKCCMTCRIPAASRRLRGAGRLRDACGVALDNAATMAPAGEHLLKSKPNCFCRVRSLPLGSNPPPPGGTCGWFLHVRTRGVLGYLFLPSRRAGGDAARPLAR